MKYVLLAIMALLIIQNAVAEINATTDDGVRVLLNKVRNPVNKKFMK